MASMPYRARSVPSAANESSLMIAEVIFIEVLPKNNLAYFAATGIIDWKVVSV